MAEEGNLGLGRAAHDRDDDEPSKEELQRRMAEARESITQTVTEIKETVTNQYYSMKESVTDALDWRHHFRKNPIAFSVGALSVGFLVGYGLAGTFKGNGQEESAGFASPEETDLFARTGATPQRYEDDEARHSAFHGHSYAAQPITDGPHETASQEEARSSSQAFEESEDERPTRGANYSYSAPRAQEEAEDNRPSLLDRFKETSAYDRLQTEVSSLGDRFIDELSKTAHNVVLPALFNKIKELFGVDLSGKKQGQGQTASSQESTTKPPTTGASAPGPNAQAASASASLASASRGTSSYATSENREYGARASEGAAANSNQDDSVLDLDR